MMDIKTQAVDYAWHQVAARVSDETQDKVWSQLLPILTTTAFDDISNQLWDDTLSLITISIQRLSK